MNTKTETTDMRLRKLLNYDTKII